MTDLAHIIENDDIEKFKLHFNVEHWKESVAQIQNYGLKDEKTRKSFPFLKESYDDADCVKYALHCNADKIFNYVLPFVDVDKHGDNYGWPLLAMALENNRYDYAKAILHHPSFNIYPIYHTNAFLYIDSRKDVQAHVDFLFEYLEKFNGWTLQNKRNVYEFSHLICYSEDTFNRFEECYRRKLRNPDASLMEFFSDEISLLSKEIFDRKYNEFMIAKLSHQQIEQIINKASQVEFVTLFEGQHAQNGIMHLLKAKDAFMHYLDNNNIMLSYMNLECIQILIDNGFDVWKENKDNVNALDFIIKDIHEEKTQYFVEMYPQEILERLHAKGRKKPVQSYCEQLLLQKALPQLDKKTTLPKI